MKTSAAATTSLLLLAGSTGAFAFVQSAAGRFYSVSQMEATSKAGRQPLSTSPSLECSLFRQTGRRSETVRGTVHVQGRRTESKALRMGLLDDLLKSKGDPVKAANADVLMSYESRVKKINDLEDEIEGMTDDQLRAKTQEFRDRLSAGGDFDDVLEEAFAVVREAAWRVLELRHYDVQLLGGLALHEGKLAEMATGEGKTLVATLPCYLNALAGKGTVLVVTANDYLARRDAETMGQVHRFLGLSVGLIQSNMPEAQRKQAYSADVTYATNQELGFDYLRDHLTVTKDGAVQAKDFYFCLVDEADSILIDEARTPLIISRSVDAPAQKFATSWKIAGVLEKGLHYTVSAKRQREGFSASFWEHIT